MTADQIETLARLRHANTIEAREVRDELADIPSFDPRRIGLEQRAAECRGRASMMNRILEGLDILEPVAAAQRRLAGR